MTILCTGTDAVEISDLSRLYYDSLEGLSDKSIINFSDDHLITFIVDFSSTPINPDPKTSTPRKDARTRKRRNCGCTDNPDLPLIKRARKKVKPVLSENTKKATIEIARQLRICGRSLERELGHLSTDSTTEAMNHEKVISQEPELKSGNLEKKPSMEHGINNDVIRRCTINDDDVMNDCNKDDDTKQGGIKHYRTKNDRIKHYRIKNDRIENDDIKEHHNKMNGIKHYRTKNDGIENDGINGSRNKNDAVKHFRIKNDGIKNDGIKNDGIKEQCYTSASEINLEQLVIKRRSYRLTKKGTMKIAVSRETVEMGCMLAKGPLDIQRLVYIPEPLYPNSRAINPTTTHGPTGRNMNSNKPKPLRGLFGTSSSTIFKFYGVV